MKVKMLGGKKPKRSTPAAAAYDLYTPNQVNIDPGELKIIPIGIAVAFPEGWAAMIFDRSGLGIQGIQRHAGLIDPDYRGEWKIALMNHGSQPMRFVAGDRIAQVAFVEVGQKEPEEVDELPTTVRGAGGFGSTGN
jgi:dUTP pyrophosphatase